MYNYASTRHELSDPPAPLRLQELNRTIGESKPEYSPLCHHAHYTLISLPRPSYGRKCGWIARGRRASVRSTATAAALNTRSHINLQVEPHRTEIKTPHRRRLCQHELGYILPRPLLQRLGDAGAENGLSIS